MVIKGVVFFSFWQGLVISYMCSRGMITATLDYTQTEVADGLQDFMICIEMAFAALAHSYVFSYKDFLRPELAHLHASAGLDADGRAVARHYGFMRALRDLLPLDVFADARSHVVRGFQRHSTRESGKVAGAADVTIVTSDGKGSKVDVDITVKELSGASSNAGSSSSDVIVDASGNTSASDRRPASSPSVKRVHLPSAAAPQLAASVMLPVLTSARPPVVCATAAAAAADENAPVAFPMSAQMAVSWRSDDGPA